MKTYYRIANKIYNEPWLITPSMHESIRKQFEAHIANIKAQLPDDEDEGEEEPAAPQLINAVGLIRVYGTLGNKLSMLETECGGVDCESIGEQLKAFANNPDVSSIVIDFDSPGGVSQGIPELAQLISEVDKVKPVYAYCSATCASAAYWLASQARAIVVSPSSDIGCVGCYMYLEDQT